MERRYERPQSNGDYAGRTAPTDTIHSMITPPFKKVKTTLADTIKGMSSQFVVSDLERSIRFYNDQLGFTVAFRYQDFYAGLECSGHSLHLKAGNPPKEERERKRKNEHVDLSIGVKDLDGLFELILSKDIEVTQHLRTMPYGREFYISDPDGYILAFVEESR